MSHPLPSALAPLMTKDFPPQRAFHYPLDNWLAWLGGIPEAIEAIENLPPAVDRPTVARAFESLWPDNIPGAFVATMIWGYGTVNRGPYRSAEILTQATEPKGAPIDTSVTDRLRTSVEVVRTNGPGDAYEYLNNDPGKIRGLGPAFFTKP